MKYIKIRANSYNEAMMKLKKEYGEDAIPISHKYIKEGGLFKTKLFSKQVVELTAGIHNRKKTNIPKLEKKNIDFLVGGKDRFDLSEKKEHMQGKEQASKPADINMENLGKTIDALNSSLNSFNTDKPADLPVKKISSSEITGLYNKETNNYPGKNEKLFEKLLDAGNETKKLSSEKKISNIIVDRDEKNGDNKHGSEDGNLKMFDEVLKNNDYDIDERKSILDRVRNSISKDDLKDRYKIEKSLKDLLKSSIVTTGPIKTGRKKKVLMFIGPTGVGKTTTMAKLGAIYSLRESRRVVFITVDNYRIAATEQLKKYAEIMKIPVFAVNNRKDYIDIINSENAEIVMVDTSGRSHKNQSKIFEIKEYADLEDCNVEKILCVSANIKKRDIDEVFKAFNIMDFNSIIITKVDETSFVGNVVDIADKYNKPIAYFTNGQEVPNDIEVADPNRIVDMIIGDINN